MARPRGPDDDLDLAENVEDIEALARLVRQMALHMNTDPPLPRPAWLSDHAGAMPPLALLALVEEHDPQAVARARAFLARPNSFTRRKGNTDDRL